MLAYHQMGHASQNLLNDPSCDRYVGAIASPVDYTEAEVSEQASKFGSKQFEVILDCQLYYPQALRGKLSQWSYFPTDVDTADSGSMTWWTEVAKGIAETVHRTGVHAVCSPATVPRVFSNDYFGLVCDVAKALADELSDQQSRVIPTLLVKTDDLAAKGRSEEIASIVTGFDFSRAYVVFITGVDPRRELREDQDLAGAIKLIRSLEDAGVRTVVGFSSSDVVLWGAAGATAAATGKFFNLRRFTQSRFAPPAGGGGQLPYWFEPSLLAFLREADLLRLVKADIVKASDVSNLAGRTILAKLEKGTGQPWLSESWRQYMWWFADTTTRATAGYSDARNLCQGARETWQQLSRVGLVMEEPANDGTWLASWIRALDSAR